MANIKQNPCLVCSTCGKDYGKRVDAPVPWYRGICDICGSSCSITPSINYNLYKKKDDKAKMN